MKSVTLFESNLLKILYAILSDSPTTNVGQVAYLIETEMPGRAPKKLTRSSIELIESALTKGCIKLLSKWGGWKRESFLRNGEAKPGKLWERSEPNQLGLRFSTITLDLLIWLTHAEIARHPLKWKPKRLSQLTLGDQFFQFLLIRAFRRSAKFTRICGHPVMMQNGLICLAFPNCVAQCKPKGVPDLAPWLEGPGSTVLESLQSPLAEYWLEIEHSKRTIVSAKKMRSLGEFQTQILKALVTAANNVRRADLYRFLLPTMSKLFSTHTKANDWMELLETQNQRIADRTATQLAALALPRTANLLNQNHQKNLLVSYIDDDYPSSQLWKSDWERFDGNHIVKQAEHIMKEVAF